MVEVDRMMMEDYKIDLLQMMENAGRNLAQLAQHFLEKSPDSTGHIAVLAGSGGNGGGALVSARHLANRGHAVFIVLVKESKYYRGAAAHQLEIVQRMQIPVIDFSEIEKWTHVRLILDGLIGYSLQGKAHGIAAKVIQWANAQQSPAIALDVPSGMDATSGRGQAPVVVADATLTLALPKKGFVNPHAGKYYGRLFLGDISVPPALYVELGITTTPLHLFAKASILSLKLE